MDQGVGAKVGDEVHLARLPDPEGVPLAVPLVLRVPDAVDAVLGGAGAVRERASVGVRGVGDPQGADGDRHGGEAGEREAEVHVHQSFGLLVDVIILP
jgi:hypothetical protein